ncbi:N-carbamoylsarcosine amidase [compost metagenome]
MRLGFLIIDMQKIYLHDQVEKKAIDQACEYINYVAESLRSNGHLIVHIQDIEGMEQQEADTDLYHFISEIQMDEGDVVIKKEYSNAFWKTDLEQLLRNHAVDLVIISGFAAEHCVLFTYNGAIERGFKPVILQKGILSTHFDAITSAYRDRNLISYPVIDSLVSN